MHAEAAPTKALLYDTKTMPKSNAPTGTLPLEQCQPKLPAISNGDIPGIENFPPKLTVRFLVARAGRGTTELLGFAAAGVGDEEVAVVGHEEVLDLALRCLVHVLLVEGHDGFGNSLADGVDLPRGHSFSARSSMG